MVGGWWLVTHSFLTLYTGTCVSYLSSLALLKRVVQKTVASSTFSLSTDPQVLKNLLSGMRRVFLEQNGGGERTTVDLFNNVLKEVFAPVEEGKEGEGKEEEGKEEEESESSDSSSSESDEENISAVERRAASSHYESGTDRRRRKKLHGEKTTRGSSITPPQ